MSDEKIKAIIAEIKQARFEYMRDAEPIFSMALAAFDKCRKICEEHLEKPE